LVSFDQVKGIISDSCVSCHTGFHSSWENFDEDLFLDTGLVSLNGISSSELLTRIKFYGGASSNMPLTNNNQIKVFSKQDYDLLVSWVKSIPANQNPNIPIEPTAPAEKIELYKKPRTANSSFITEVFKSIFVEDFNDLHRDQKAAITSVETNVPTFGGSCNFYSTYSGGDCGSDIVSGMSNDADGEFSVSKALGKTVACEKIIFRGMTVASARFNLDTSQDVNATNISKVHSLFYRSRTITSDEQNLIYSFVQSLKAKNVEPLDQWKFVFQVICEQPGWEVL
jgi:hypothetical protein